PLVYGTSAQRKSDCERVAVRAAEKAIVGNELKGSPLFECGQFVVDVYVHKNNNFTVVSAKLLYYKVLQKDN
ncbi:MAG: hypothetical protein SPF81_09555, partial [Sodaliphilus sp.]|nr:hypothetical protein [Sodaliphilus sp.]